MSNLTPLDELIGTVRNGTYSTSLNSIKQDVGKIWGPSFRIIKDYTSHGLDHSDRIAQYVLKLIGLNSSKRTFTDEELYLISASVCLHDIGMQCDIIKYKDIKKRSEKLGASFPIDLKSEKSSDFSQEEQNAIRENHQYISAAWIDLSHNSCPAKKTPLEARIPDDLVGDLMTVCMYHSKLPINDCDEESKITRTRLRLISAILRLADELDISESRVTMDAYDGFRVDPENYIHWCLHDHTKVHFRDGSNNILINIILCSRDYALYRDLIKELYIEKFKTKNQAVINVLIKNGIAICIDDESNVIENTHEKCMPPEICRNLIEYYIDQKESCKVLRIGERFTGKINKLVLISKKFGEYISIECDCEKRIFLPKKGEIYSILHPVPHKTVSILRKTADDYEISIGPRFLDIGERVDGRFGDTRKVNENLYLMLIGDHELKIPKNVANGACTLWLKKNDFISISRNETGYEVTPIQFYKS